MIEGLVEQFAALDDPRCAGKVEQRLVDVLVVAVCAVVAGAETFEDIALYGRCKEGWLRGFLELPGGIPSHDTFRRVLMLVDPDAFERCFLAPRPAPLAAPPEMGWTAPDGIDVPECGLLRATQKEPSAMSITMIGLDTAKAVFHAHGVGDDGMAQLRRALRRRDVIAGAVARLVEEAWSARLRRGEGCFC